MDKMYNISLGGYGFSIEDKAYKLLLDYLNKVTTALRATEDSDEIIKDIEYRIAELFKRRLVSREVVNIEDVKYVMETMGHPSEYIQEDDQKESYSTNQNKFINRKTLYRDPNDRMIGGVLSGLSYYLGIKVTTLRIIIGLLPILDFLFLGISTSVIVISYIILWIVIPKAQTTVEILEMQGKPVNFDSIKEFVNDNSPFVKDKAKNLSDSVQRFANDNNGSLEHILSLVAKALLIIIVLSGLSLAVFLFVVFMATSIGIGTFGISVGSLSTFIFDYNWQSIVAYVSLTTFLLIPIIVLILLLIRLLSNHFRTSKFIYISLLILFILSFIGLTYSAVNIGLNFNSEAVINKRTEINELNDILKIKGSRDLKESPDSFTVKIAEGSLFVFDDKLWNNQDIVLYIEPSDTNQVYMNTEIKAYGRNILDAEHNAEITDYNLDLKENQLLIPDYYTIKEGFKFRGQTVENTLYIPNNKEFTIENIDRLYVKENGDFNRLNFSSEDTYAFVYSKLNCISCEGFNDSDLNNQRVLTDTIQ